MEFSDQEAAMNATDQLCTVQNNGWIDVIRTNLSPDELRTELTSWMEFNAGREFQATLETAEAAQRLLNDLSSLESLTTVMDGILKDLNTTTSDLQNASTFATVEKLFCGRSDNFFSKLGNQDTDTSLSSINATGMSKTEIDSIGCRNSTMAWSYSGHRATTINGYTCQAWAEQSPQSHTTTNNKDDQFPDGSVSAAKNYCRNPDNEPYGPWCYTTDPDTRWEYCSIPMCSSANSNVRTKNGNSEGRYCEFPFIFNDTKYNECTTDDHPVPWCAVTDNYDRDELWGECMNRCDELFDGFKYTTEGKAIWKQIKPMIKGRIPYTPDNPVTESIMKQANASFYGIGRLQAVAQDWLNYSPTFKHYLNNSENIEPIRTLLKFGMSQSDKNSTRYRMLSIWNKWLNNGPESEDTYDWRDSVRYMDEYATAIVETFKCFVLDKFEPMESEEALIQQSQKYIEDGTYWAAIQFDNMDENTTTMPTHITYRLRLDASKVDGTTQIRDKYWIPGARASTGIDTKYITFGFAYLQDMIEHGIITEMVGQNVTLPGIVLQQFPYPCYINDRYAFYISRAIPLFMVLAWLFSVAFSVKSIVREKERRLKEVMKMMGLTNFVHWVAWFITIMFNITVSIALLVLILKVGRVLEHSDGFVVFVFLMSFALCTIMQCFLFSTLFSKANLAAACSCIFYFLLYLPYTLFIQWEEYMSVGQKFAGCLLSSVSFGFGCSYIARYEEQSIGLQWSNIDSSPIPGDGFTCLRCIFMMLLDAVLYALLTWYIEAVFPGQFGLPQHWYFPFTKTYWCSGPTEDPSHVTHSRGTYSIDHTHDVDMNQLESPNFETEPTGLRIGVAIQNLHKKYRKEKTAVDGLSCRFYEGQITSFLGHNGAGKTTTMSILTGLFPPTSGTAHIYDKDIRFSMNDIRKSLGMCPQHNVLFDQLTVSEHLWFYARLKGVKEKEVENEMEQMINDVQLAHKRQELSLELSGGMKRKLSVAIAFVGGSKTVILDEPTAGVDPAARRQIWELILKYKKDRTIILTTHHMDEADVLGDRIAIIANGKLKCCGSSLFLKSRFGNGYYLTVVKADQNKMYRVASAEDEYNYTNNDGIQFRASSAASKRTLTDIKLRDDDDGYASKSDRTDSNPPSQSPTPPLQRGADSSASLLTNESMTEVIQRFVPDAQLVEDVGQELCYQLPEEGAKSGAFVRLFTYLDTCSDELGVSSYGISDTSLEEVFLAVADEANLNEDSEIRRQQLEELSDGGRFPRPVTRMSIRRKIKSFFNKKKNWNTLSETDSSNVSIAGESDTEPDTLDDSISTHGGGTSKITGPRLILKQLGALFIKRFHHVRRSKKGFVCEVLLPAAFICIAMVFATIQPSDYNQPPLELQPWMYTPTPDLDSPHLYTFYSNDAPSSELAKKLEMLLVEGLFGTRCMNSSVYAINGYACEPDVDHEKAKWSLSFPPDVANNMSKQCSCDTGFQTCPADAAGPEPPTSLLDTTDYLLNMTKRNISDWIVKTRQDFIRKRYGGYSFGDTNQIAQVNATQLKSLFDRVGKIINNGRPTDSGQLFDIEELLKNLVTRNDIKVWYNNKGWAAGVSYMNAVNNMILRAHLPAGKDPRNYGITGINHPMNLTKAQLTDRTLNSAWINVIISICVIFAMSTIPASFVLYLIEDRVSSSKHLQFVSGVNPVIYWISTYIWDIMSYSVSASICLLIFVAFNAEAFIIAGNVGCLVALLLLYGWAVIPMMYPFSYVFKVPSSAFVALSCMNIFLGITTTIATYILDLFPDEDLKLVNNALKEIFLIFPHYCLGRGLLDMAYNYLNYQVGGIFGIGEIQDPFVWEQVGKNLFCLAVEGVLFFILILLIQYEFFVPKTCRTTNHLQLGTNPSICEDEDVAAERERVLAGGASGDMLILEELTKVYRKSSGGSLVAVNKLCVGVPKGQCFGLLGINGAGKTSTFKMLTGDTDVTSGKASLAGYSILTDMRKVNQHMGYCPQFDALDSLLTGKEHLEFYARLRGIPEHEISQVTEWCLKKLGLKSHANKPSWQFSGGNKRKLSTAIALIGNPPVIFLDEPTTGMDPKARRFLWSCLNNIVKEGRSVILTSHSMEECEALCSRVGIMVNGTFQCLGSIQHLKNRFGDGYTIIVRVSGTQPNLIPLKSYMSEVFEDSTLKEEHHNMLQYHLGSSVSLGGVFSQLESVREKYLIEDYSVSQTTLDQVFVNLANMQSEDLEEIIVTDDSPLRISLYEDASLAGSTLELIPQETLPSRTGGLTPVEA